MDLPAGRDGRGRVHPRDDVIGTGAGAGNRLVPEPPGEAAPGRRVARRSDPATTPGARSGRHRHDDGERPCHVARCRIRASGRLPQVRALQRILRSLGYACGPVDGLFGTRTQASLQWFQIKHGLRPTGSADAKTLRILHLRDRARGPQDAVPRAEAPASSQAPTRPANAPHAHPAVTPSDAPANAPRPHPAATPSPGARAPQPGGRGLGAVPIALLLAAAIALLSLLLTVGWRRSWRTHASSAAARLARRLRSAPARLRHTKAAPARPRAGPGQS